MGSTWKKIRLQNLGETNQIGNWTGCLNGLRIKMVASIWTSVSNKQSLGGAHLLHTFSVNQTKEESISIPQQALRYKKHLPHLETYHSDKIKSMLEMTWRWRRKEVKEYNSNQIKAPKEYGI